MNILKRPRSVDGGPLLFTNKGLVSIIVPLMIQQVLTVAVGAVDTVMVAYAGEAAVSGVSLVNTLDVLLVMFFSSLVTGGAVVVAQTLGRKNMDDARSAAKQLLYVATAMALLVTVTVLTFRKPLLSLLFGSAEADVMYSAERYFFFVALSFPFLAIHSGVASIFQVSGNSVISMTVSFVTNLINIGGNALFIIALGKGSAGAAIATLICRIVGAGIMLVLINRKNHIFYIEKLLHYKPDLKVIKEILRIGVPNGIENGMFQFGRLLTQSLISSMGTATIAANAVALTISNFQYMAGSAYSSAMITVVGRCVGAKEIEQAKYYSRLMAVLNYITLWMIVLVTVVFLSPIVSLYDLSTESSAIMWPIGFMLPSAFRAAGDVRFPLIVSVITMWIFRVAGSYVLALDTVSVFGLFSFKGLGMGVMGVWVAMTVDWVFRAALFLVRYLSGRWLLQKDKKDNKKEGKNRLLSAKR